MVEKQENLLIEQKVKEEFKNVRVEEEKREQEEWEKKLGDNAKYVEELNGSGYLFCERGLCTTRWDDTKEEISNLLAVPVKKINIDTGEEITSEIEIKGILNTGEELENIKIPITKLEGTKWYINPQWGLKVRFAPSAKRDLLIDSIKVLGKNMEEETIYKFTGFADIDGQKVFLHSGGAVGTTQDIKVDLGDEVLSRFKLTEKEFDIKDTLKMTLSCLDTAPIHITIPILALVFFAPLTSIVEEMGIPIGFLMWVIGPQQCKKTSLVCAFISHDGNFDKNHAPLSFLDGVQSASRKCAMLKDVCRVM